MENINDVIAYDCVDVLHAALIRFNVISVENLVKGVIFCEMDIYLSYLIFLDILTYSCCDTFTTW